MKSFSLQFSLVWTSIWVYIEMTENKVLMDSNGKFWMRKLIQFKTNSVAKFASNVWILCSCNFSTTFSILKILLQMWQFQNLLYFRSSIVYNPVTLFLKEIRFARHFGRYFEATLLLKWMIDRSSRSNLRDSFFCFNLQVLPGKTINYPEILESKNTI